MATTEVENLRRAAEGVEPDLVNAASAFLAAPRSADEELLAARTLSFLGRGVESLDPREVREVLASPEPGEALTAMIERVLIERSEQPALVRARIGGARRRQELLDAEGGWLSAEQAAGRLTSRAALDKRRERGTILALPRANKYVYPVWQFDEDTRHGLLPGLREVLEGFGVESPWMRAEFLLAHHDELGGRRAIDALSEGDAEAVRLLAASYGEQGAR
ncbi:hypothetical protein GBA63_22270 (plasmid) [Rubrobacter tropicus]|uniref:Uncharacterized protein n=1 Tax=Rubrobacter tropicus TaxID=2653851 RepID=A0A6G8QG07_9ACTN|nr:hypothetical protein [Rubrobacter tropicus]QIN85429.1 hypothetical protein GBA63_22270 [Rubrobacter tropicus]